jgi:uncharacterized gene 3.8 protein
MRPKEYYQQYGKPRVHVQVWTEANGPVPKGMVIDHINGDKHDNRLENLRACTVAQNIANSKMRSNNKSGVKGIVWDESCGRWKAFITLNSKRKEKRFTSLLDALSWLYAKRCELRGEYARFI